MEEEEERPFLRKQGCCAPIGAGALVTVASIVILVAGCRVRSWSSHTRRAACVSHEGSWAGSKARRDVSERQLRAGAGRGGWCLKVASLADMWVSALGLMRGGGVKALKRALARRVRGCSSLP